MVEKRCCCTRGDVVGVGGEATGNPVEILTPSNEETAWSRHLLGGTGLLGQVGASPLDSPPTGTLVPERTFDVNPDGIPEELRTKAIWAGIRTEQAEEVGGEIIKIACNPRTGEQANPRAPRTWATFDDAIEAYHRGKCEGVAFSLSGVDQIVGIILDDAYWRYNAEDWGGDIIARTNTYTERISPHGVCLFLRGWLPKGSLRNAYGVGPSGWGLASFVAHNGFLRVTGQRLAGAPTTINNRQDQLVALHRQMFRFAGRVKDGGELYGL